MRLYNFGGGRALLEEAITCFERVLERYVNLVDDSMRIWEGFVRFNLARATERQLEFTPDSENQGEVLLQYKRATRLRKSWITGRQFDLEIKNALSYEYFLAKLECIRFSHQVVEKDLQRGVQECEQLNAELEIYYDQEEKLEKLGEIQKRITDYKGALEKELGNYAAR